MKYVNSLAINELSLIKVTKYLSSSPSENVWDEGHGKGGRDWEDPEELFTSVRTRKLTEIVTVEVFVGR